MRIICQQEKKTLSLYHSGLILFLNFNIPNTANPLLSCPVLEEANYEQNALFTKFTV